MKKIPSIFRKKYTAKKLEKKIYKKLFVPDDKKYVKGLFAQVEKKGSKNIPVYAIPQDKAEQLAKKDMKRLKLLAKQIKSQKGRVNIVPLFVTIAFIAAISVCFTLFKNILIKKAIQTVCENTFEARCDIQTVDFKLLNASLRIKKIEIANKDDVMKNLVDIGSISLDFDLAQLLRRHFVADELSVLEVYSGTERTVSGELPPQKLKKIKNKKEKAEKKSQESGLGKLLSEKKDAASASLQQSITGLFGQFNPETLMNSYYAQLQTPALSNQVQEKVPQIVAKWQSKPAEVQKTVDDLQKSVNEIVSFDFNSVQNNPLKIKEFIENLDATYKNIDKVKNDANGVLVSFNSDMSEVDNLRKTVQNAVNHDMAFANSEINKITSLNMSDGTKLISGIFENVAYDIFGKYYPYVHKGISYLLDLKTKQGGEPKKDKAKKEKKEKTKYTVQRAPGCDIVYRQDKTPSVWIKKMAGSGANFYAQATNIASNQDLINKPAKIDFNMDLKDIRHTAKVVVDFRTETAEPLVRADYGVKNVPFNIPSKKFGEYPGVPSFDADCALDAIIKIFDDEGFELTGKGLFTNLKISTVPFEPQNASKIYSSVMSRINTVRAGITSGFTESDGLKLNIESDADVQVMNSLKKEMDAQLAGIKENLKGQLTQKINEASGGALGDFAALDDIKKKLTSSIYTANSFETQLTKKRTEAEKQLTGKASQKANEAKKQAAENATKAIGNQLKKLF